jgi:xanthine dehydrogenase accessory factor
MRSMQCVPPVPLVPLVPHAEDHKVNWLAAITSLLEEGTPGVLITVAAVQGSAPREPGAKMLVTRTAQLDTIGGGHLEMRACEIARDMLNMSAALPASTRRLARFPLGPSLGQCCGGMVHLAFERLDGANAAYYASLAERTRDRQDSWRIVPLDAGRPASLHDETGSCIAGSQLPLPGRFDRERPTHLVKDNAGNHWLIDACRAHRPHLVLFGAGHVGAALVRALADLPCHVTWVDEREDIFPDAVPANVKVDITDTPEAVVDAVPADSSFIVMTHSHALDQRLAEAILRRTGAGWFGLIGSKTKRLQFEHRLRERGIADQRLPDMVCPIGLPGIAGKAPAVIAASVCAQLLQVWEAAQLRHEHDADLARKSA